MILLNLKGALAWFLLGLAQRLARVAHNLCTEVPDVDDLRAESFEWGRAVGRQLR